MTLNPLDKLIITDRSKRQNGRVIGMKVEPNGTITYIIEPRRVDFGSYKNGSRLIRINSLEIETNKICVEKHTV